MPRQDYSGPALFSYGFRPFFLSACLFALAIVPVWLLVWRGTIALSGPFSPVSWHVHEMIFGYGAAVLAGFLFTAVPNWTGRMPTRGAPLAVLLVLWLAGRLAVAGMLGLPAWLVMPIDVGFLVAVAAMIAREIVAGRNWKNLKVLVPVGLMALANAGFHVEAALQGAAPVSERAGLSLLVFLIMLIGGRIVPSFTRNWLASTGSLSRPKPFDRFDMVSLGVGAAALLGWTLAPEADASGPVLALAALLHLLRLVRWVGFLTLGSPLLTMLHLAYLFIPLGLASAAMESAGLTAYVAPAHLLGIGAVAGMTLAVMMRASLGHTGRALVSGPLLNIAFLMLPLAALVRLGGHSDVLPGLDGVHLAASLWTLGFALAAWRMVPWLVTPRVAARKPSRARRPA